MGNNINERFTTSRLFEISGNYKEKENFIGVDLGEGEILGGIEFCKAWLRLTWLHDYYNRPFKNAGFTFHYCSIIILHFFKKLMMQKKVITYAKK